ncbi:MAG: 16S rRNA (cytosine(1402)-N(4))-methyltransferase RsmH [Oscillospiraceae bacterium]|jgi:16S rRNA (cytosine1402-N4)-methyltransferase|nr:16S rRNA (cytosine(1402)-N(4))-methyltransferase RsmH [Oscillospiraceae bacterium]
MSGQQPSHVSVLLRESVDALNVRRGGVYVDCTLGLGGHTSEIARRGGTVIAIDRDETAIERSRERLSEFADAVTFVHGNFGDIGALLDKLGIGETDGILADFGISSPQIDERERGFSYSQSSTLDMRMDLGQALTAREIVNAWSESELCRIFFEYGEERYSARIASAIVRRRDETPIETTDELVDIIKHAVPNAALREAQHPAKRVFQSLRITVNNELGEIESLLAAAPKRLKRGARIACISFHSLEDRLCKESFRGYADGCTCPKDYPCVCGFVPTLRVITKKPITPSEEEQQQNPRARSAKLRVAEKL